MPNINKYGCSKHPLHPTQPLNDSIMMMMVRWAFSETDFLISSYFRACALIGLSCFTSLVWKINENSMPDIIKSNICLCRYIYMDIYIGDFNALAGWAQSINPNQLDLPTGVGLIFFSYFFRVPNSRAQTGFSYQTHALFLLVLLESQVQRVKSRKK